VYSETLSSRTIEEGEETDESPDGSLSSCSRHSEQNGVSGSAGRAVMENLARNGLPLEEEIDSRGRGAAVFPGLRKPSSLDTLSQPPIPSSNKCLSQMLPEQYSVEISMQRERAVLCEIHLFRRVLHHDDFQIPSLSETVDYPSIFL